MEQINHLLLQKFTVENSKQLVTGILQLMGITNLNFIYTQNSTAKIIDSTKKSMFEDDEKFVDYKAAYDIVNNYYEVDNKQNQLILPRLFVIKKYSRSNVVWLNKLGINFEDEIKINRSHPIGIDFVIFKDRFLVVVSNVNNLRLLELNSGEKLNSTQMEILASWNNLFTQETNKELLHGKLWNSLNLESVNKKFYADIIQTFDKLREHLVDNKIFDNNKAVIFTNRLIGRLLFCYFLKKKSVIRAEYFEIKENSDNEYYKTTLSKLFFAVLNTPINERKHDDHYTPYLNGGLFEKKDTDIDNISFPSNYFNEIFTIFKKYNWTVDESLSNYEVVAIDPEMLGRIFENLLAQINQNDGTGESARKAKGAFYTPRAIVDYICKESLKQYLKTNSEEHYDNIIDKLIDASTNYIFDQKKNWKDDVKLYKEHLITILGNITVIDPACGSGAFPIGMMHLILQTYERLDDKENVTKRKMQIISKNIFGADIEPNAVEITRLRTWLSIIVDEDKENIEKLPNLDFKFVCCNSLVKFERTGQSSLADNFDIMTKLQEVKIKYYDVRTLKSKLDIQNQYKALIETLSRQDSSFGKSRYTEQIESYSNPFNTNNVCQFYDNELTFGVKDGFDVVIGNPPYVSTKGIQKFKKELKLEFGFADDLYNHFYFKGLEILKSNGTLSYITSNTFWTIQTKNNLRNYLLKYKILEIAYTGDAFDSAMVDTCVVTVKKELRLIDHEIQWTNRNNPKLLITPETLSIKQKLYEDSNNQVIFEPSDKNKQIYDKIHLKLLKLYKNYWKKILTSVNITKNAKELNQYRAILAAGDFTLLGLITDGGQGLATANNGKFIGVLEGTKQADKLNLVDGRAKKLYEAIKNEKITDYKNIIDKHSAHTFLQTLTEQEIRDLFDHWKDKYGRDIFGQGYIYKIISKNELANLQTLSADEKKNGIRGSKVCVPYDKGDKDGNQWYLPTPFYINWSVNSVNVLKDRNSGSRWQGDDFFFKEGFCWNFSLNPASRIIKCRVKEISINDVNAMSMYLLANISFVSSKYLICLINSNFAFDYIRTFINNTAGLQINDLRMLPIVVPTNQQLKECEEIFDEAYEIKKLQQHSNQISKETTDNKLNAVRDKLNIIVDSIYGI